MYGAMADRVGSPSTAYSSYSSSGRPRRVRRPGVTHISKGSGAFTTLDEFLRDVSQVFVFLLLLTGVATLFTLFFAAASQTDLSSSGQRDDSSVLANHASSLAIISGLQILLFASAALFIRLRVRNPRIFATPTPHHQVPLSRR